MPKRLHLALLAIILSIFLEACGVPTHVTGGGWIPSNSGDGKANFGFNADACEDPFKATGHFNFHDKKGLIANGASIMGGIKLNGKVVEASRCVADDPSLPVTSGCQVCESLLGIDGKIDYHALSATYDSTNPKALGSGIVYACAKDNGEGGKSSSDLAVITIVGGPFDGYINAGPVQGNIQQHRCEQS